MGLAMTERGDILRELSALNLGLGVVKGQNERIIEEQERAANDRSEIYRLHSENQAELSILQQSMGRVEGSIKEMQPKVQYAADACKEIPGIKTEIQTFQDFRIQMALAATVVGAIVSGAVTLIWLAVTHLGDIKEAFRTFLK